MMFRIVFVLLCLFTLQLSAQDTTRTVIITGQKTPKDSIATQHISSARLFPFQQGSVQQVLELISNVVVKNYGIGSLSTISIRGSSAAQTQVYWEGLNINNAMTGLTDFSLIPTMLFDQIDIHYGNNPTSAALSGSITLEQQGPRFQKRASVKAMLGAESFGNLSGGFNLHTSSKRLSNHCRVTVNRSENKYRYINEDQQAWINISNASSRQFNFLNDLYLKLNAKHMLSWHLWLTQQQREIPPARNEAVSEKQEDHQNLRSIVRWDYHPSSKRSASATAGILFDQYHYTDPMVKLNNRAAVLSVPVQYQLNFKPNSHQHIQLMAKCQSCATTSATGCHIATCRCIGTLCK
jgi:vitamin B12 transporter